jgi:hypothetical protein
MRASAALTLVVVVVFPVFAWYGGVADGWAGIAAAAVAAAACYLGALLALIAGAAFGEGEKAVNGVLVGMLFRTGLPLIVGLALDRQGGPLAEAGVFGMVLCFYFVTLTAETMLAVRLRAAADKQTDVTENT